MFEKFEKFSFSVECESAVCGLSLSTVFFVVSRIVFEFCFVSYALLYFMSYNVLYFVLYLFWHRIWYCILFLYSVSQLILTVNCIVCFVLGCNLYCVC